ncbi:hypothetical protein QTN25_007647 [Entamoeba marina]
MDDHSNNHVDGLDTGDITSRPFTRSMSSYMSFDSTHSVTNTSKNNDLNGEIEVQPTFPNKNQKKDKKPTQKTTKRKKKSLIYRPPKPKKTTSISGNSRTATKTVSKTKKVVEEESDFNQSLSHDELSSIDTNKSFTETVSDAENNNDNINTPSEEDVFKRRTRKRAVNKFSFYHDNEETEMQEEPPKRNRSEKNKDSDVTDTKLTNTTQPVKDSEELNESKQQSSGESEDENKQSNKIRKPLGITTDQINNIEMKYDIIDIDDMKTKSKSIAVFEGSISSEDFSDSEMDNTTVTQPDPQLSRTKLVKALTNRSFTATIEREVVNISDDEDEDDIKYFHSGYVIKSELYNNVNSQLDRVSYPPQPKTYPIIQSPTTKIPETSITKTQNPVTQKKKDVAKPRKQIQQSHELKQKPSTTNAIRDYCPNDSPNVPQNGYFERQYNNTVQSSFVHNQQHSRIQGMNEYTFTSQHNVYGPTHEMAQNIEPPNVNLSGYHNNFANNQYVQPYIPPYMQQVPILHETHGYPTRRKIHTNQLNLDLGNEQLPLVPFTRTIEEIPNKSIDFSKEKTTRTITKDKKKPKPPKKTSSYEQKTKLLKDKKKSIKKDVETKKDYAMKHVPMDENMMICLGIITKLMEREESEAFKNEVDPITLNILDYYEVIEKPMDFGTILLKLRKNKYKTKDDFANDVRLVFNNAMKYNLDDNSIYRDAKVLSDIFEKTFATAFVGKKKALYMKTFEDQNPSNLPIVIQPTFLHNNYYYEDEVEALEMKQQMDLALGKTTERKQLTLFEKQSLCNKMCKISSKKIAELLNHLNFSKEPGVVKQIDLNQFDDDELREIDKLVTDVMAENDMF